VVSNQTLAARAVIPFEDFRLEVFSTFQSLLEDSLIDDFRVCFHHPSANYLPLRIDNCSCRKPSPGMIIDLIRSHALQPSHSLILGDRISDILAARNADLNEAILLLGPRMLEANISMQSKHLGSLIQFIKINIGFCAEKILFHFRETFYMDRPIFLYEKDILGPAQTLVQLSRIDNGKTLVIHGDLVLSDEGFYRFVEFAKRAKSQVIVCHERPRSQARSEVICSLNQRKMEKIIEYSSKNNQLDLNTKVLVSSGIFIIDLSKVSGFNAEAKQSLSPDLLNFINYEKMDVYLWSEWRYAIDSIATLEEVRLKLSSNT